MTAVDQALANLTEEAFGATVSLGRNNPAGRTTQSSLRACWYDRTPRRAATPRSLRS